MPLPAVPVRQLPANIEPLGDATGFVDRIYSMLDNIELFEDFERAEIQLLAHFMSVYRVPPATEIIREGDAGDYMLLVIDGEFDIFKNDNDGFRKRIAIVGAGKTLGEMSMIDGEPRFASCMAVRETVFATLTRDNMAKIILEKPSLGAKVLVKLVTMLSQRLRQTSIRLLQYMK